MIESGGLFTPASWSQEPSRLQQWISKILGKGETEELVIADTCPIFAENGETALPVLIALVSDEDPRIRKNAVAVLGDLGPQAKNAVPALLKITKDENSTVSSLAQQVVLNIDPEAAKQDGILNEEEKAIEKALKEPRRRDKTGKR